MWESLISFTSGLWGRVARLKLDWGEGRGNKKNKTPTLTQTMWQNALHSDETKVELSGHNSQRYVWCKNTQRTPYHGEAWWSMVVAGSHYGSASLQLWLGIIFSSKYQFISAQNLQASVRWRSWKMFRSLPKNKECWLRSKRCSKVLVKQCAYLHNKVIVHSTPTQKIHLNVPSHLRWKNNWHVYLG